MTARKRKAVYTIRKDVKFYSEDFLAKKLGIDRRKFHREIKPIIIADFQDLLLRNGIENPDIGLDTTDKLYLGNTTHNIVIPTGLCIYDYI